MQFSIGSRDSRSAQQFEVRVISRKEDPYAGLKGHDYIKARNLAPVIKRVQTSAQNSDRASREVCE